MQLEALEFDIKQILSNCEIYNQEGSAIIADASQLVEKLIAAIEPYRDEGALFEEQLSFNLTYSWIFVVDCVQLWRINCRKLFPPLPLRRPRLRRKPILTMERVWS